VTAGLFVLLVAERALHARRDHRAEEQTLTSLPAEPAPAARRAEPRPSGPVRTATAPAAESPVMERLARLATRRQLYGEGRGTYLDSMLLSTDSIVRRWPDRQYEPLRVVIREGGAEGYAPRMAELVRQAFRQWEGVGVGLRFEEVRDSALADITVRWVETFEFDRVGQTDLAWDQRGHVRHAVITLAVRASTGPLLSDASLLGIAIHETGHAIGLPHSAELEDVMFPATQVDALSMRDERTARLLYRLPPGSVKDEPPRP
jgi:hypothetical protein